jgi:serine acetyltransferase
MPAEPMTAAATPHIVGTRDSGAWRELMAAIRADHRVVVQYATKYRVAAGVSRHLLLDVVRKIGFQMMVICRLMRFARALRLPLVPEMISRAARHLYGSDIHWEAQFEPGVAIVHGMGMCISHRAIVGSGSILFQGVTLGEGIDPDTRSAGSPRLERDVHVGPGATLLGPITIGAGSKIMAGCVVTRSVPPNSLVEACSPVVRPRPERAPAVADDLGADANLHASARREWGC